MCIQEGLPSGTTCLSREPAGRVAQWNYGTTCLSHESTGRVIQWNYLPLTRLSREGCPVELPAPHVTQQGGLPSGTTCLLRKSTGRCRLLKGYPLYVSEALCSGFQSKSPSIPPSPMLKKENRNVSLLPTPNHLHSLCTRRIKLMYHLL